MRKRAEVPPTVDPSTVQPETGLDGTRAPDGTPPPVEFPPATPTTPQQAEQLAKALNALGVSLPAVPVDSMDEAKRMATDYFAAMEGNIPTIEPDRPRTGADVLALLNPSLAMGLAGAAVGLVYQTGKHAEQDGSADSPFDLQAPDISAWAEREAVLIVDTIAAVTARIYNRSRGLEAPSSQS